MPISNLLRTLRESSTQSATQNLAQVRNQLQKDCRTACHFLNISPEPVHKHRKSQIRSSARRSNILGAVPNPSNRKMDAWRLDSAIEHTILVLEDRRSPKCEAFPSGVVTESARAVAVTT